MRLIPITASVNCQLGTASARLAECVSSAINAPHRMKEEDRFSGLLTEGGNPGGGQAAEIIYSASLARSLRSLKPKTKKARYLIQRRTNGMIC